MMNSTENTFLTMMMGLLLIKNNMNNPQLSRKEKKIRWDNAIDVKRGDNGFKKGNQFWKKRIHNNLNRDEKNLAIAILYAVTIPKCL
jgi:hypothetical protein